jgi:hypothetical protein
MSTLFSIGFSILFAAYLVAAIVGHALLIGALLRPFFGRLDLAPLLMWHGTRAQPVR